MTDQINKLRKAIQARGLYNGFLPELSELTLTEPLWLEILEEL
ncbi:MAG: hypothetical protein ACI86P_002578, partial [Flavobacteriales bacterium]